MGIAALGTAIGGFAKGYTEGEKHRSDMEDAEQRRAIGKVQLDEAQRKAKTREEMDALIKEYDAAPTPAPAATATNTAAGITPPGATATPPAAGGEALVEGGGTAPSTPKMGLAGPGAAQATTAPAAATTPTTPAPTANSWERRQELFSKLNTIAMRNASSPQELQQAMQNSLTMMKSFRDAQTDEKLSVMHDFLADGNQQKAMQRLAQSGVVLPEGTTWKKVRTPLYPGSKMMDDDVVVTSPDGNTISMNQIMLHRMDPKDLYSSKLKVAEVMNQAAYQEGLLQESKRHHGSMEEQARAQTKLQQQSFELAGKKFNFEATQAMNLKARTEAEKMAGVPRELSPKEMLDMDQKDIEAYNAKRQSVMGRANAIMVNYGLNNQTAGDGKELMPVALIDKALSSKPGNVKTEEDSGRSYVMVDKRKVYIYVPPKLTDEQQPAAPATSGAPAAPASSAAPAASAPSQPMTQAAAPVQDPGPQPVRAVGETFEAFRDRTISWDGQRQAFVSQQKNAASEQERQRLLAARGGGAISRPMVNGGAPVQAGINRPLAPGPYGQPPAYPDPNAPSIYAGQEAWYNYRQNAGR